MNDTPASRRNPNELGAQLAEAIEGIEAINRQVDDLQEVKRTIYKRARRVGFNTDALKQVIQVRRKTPAKWARMQQVVAYYLSLIDGPHQVVAAPPPETTPQQQPSPASAPPAAPVAQAPTKAPLPTDNEGAHRVGYEAGARGDSENSDPYRDPDLSEAWLTGWQKGTDAMMASYRDGTETEVAAQGNKQDDDGDDDALPADLAGGQ